MPEEPDRPMHGGAVGRDSPAEATIEDWLSEDREFPPSDEFRAQAVISDPGVYALAEADWQGFWAEQAGALDWFRPWDTVLEWDAPFARWFDGGTLNVSYNCLDRHVAAGRGDKVAFHWEGEPGDTRTITYEQMLVEVSRFANVLRGLGVGRGDRVAIYMPMIPELPVAMLACTRDRSGSLGGVRRILLRRVARQDPRCAGPGGDHRRRWLASGVTGRAQAQRRHGSERVIVRRACGGGPSDRCRRG